MGKVRKPRPSRRPVTVLEDSSEEPEVVDSKENAVHTILDQLQAANVEEKYCGLQTLGLLIESPENIEEVMNNGVIKVAAPLLIDPASSVRNAASGTLRNLSTGGHEICDKLMEQDVMTPLTCYFHEFAESWVPDPNSKSKEDFETVVNCINIIWNLCESSELAVKYLGQSKILDILSRFLELTPFGSDIVVATLQCLLVVVEDNPEAIKKVKLNADAKLQQLIKIEGGEPHQILIKTLAAGIIISICGGNVVSLTNVLMLRLISILAETLSVDHRQNCNKLSSTVPLKNENGKNVAPKGNEAQKLEDNIKCVSLLLEAQQSSVEIIANLCSNSSDGDDSIEDSSDSEEMGDEDLCNGKSKDVDDSECISPEDNLPPEIIEAMVSLNIFEKVWSKTQLPAENVILILKEYEGTQSICKKIQNLQTRALLCVNNMLSSLPLENLGGINAVYKIWVEAGKLVFKQNSENLNLLESATAVMRAALDRIKCRDYGNNSENLFSELALSDIEMMVTGIKECQLPEIRSNLIRMIGTLALLLVNTLNDTTANVICAITEFILDQAHRESEVWVLAEAIDTLVDLYSEDETDGLAAKVKLIEKLTVLSPILKNKSRQQRKLPQEYRGLVSTATSNLPRFIKYKKSRLSISQ